MRNKSLCTFGNLVKNVYTGIQLKKHMGLTAFVDTGDPVSA